MEDKFGRFSNEKYFYAEPKKLLKGKVGTKFKKIVDNVDRTLNDYDRYREREHNYLFVGGKRVGKTWLLHCMINRLISLGSNDVYYITLDELINAHREMSMKNDSTLWITFYASVESLFIDDMGSEYHKTESGYVGRKLEKFLRHRLGTYGKHTYIATSLELGEVSGKYNAEVHKILTSEFITKDLGDKIIKLHEDEEVDDFG